MVTTCTSLTQSLNAARATGAYERRLAALARVPLLIIDDFGLKPLRAPADEDLHDLMAERYEQTASIVTSNLDFPEWDQTFPSNRLLASATLDRLRHNAYCLVLDGQSYRAPQVAACQHEIHGPSKTGKIHPCMTPSGCPFDDQKLAPLRRSSVAPLRRSVTPCLPMRPSAVRATAALPADVVVRALPKLSRASGQHERVLPGPAAPRRLSCRSTPVCCIAVPVGSR